MEHSRKKVAQALIFIMIGAIFGASLIGCILMMIGVYRAYKASGAGEYAISCMFFAFMLAIAIISQLIPYINPFITNTIGIASTCCIVLSLWFMLSGTVSVLRVSRSEELISNSRIVRALLIVYGFLAALDYVLASASIIGGRIAVIKLFSYSSFALSIGILIYFFLVRKHLLRINEVDPKKVEEMRNRLK